MADALARLKEENIPYLVCSYSSLDRYFRFRRSSPLYLATDSSLVALARAFDDLQFPGLPLEDAAVENGSERPGLSLRGHTFPAALRSVHRAEAPLSIRPATSSSTGWTCTRTCARTPSRFVPDSYPRWLGLCEAAKLVSRYHYRRGGPQPGLGERGRASSRLLPAGPAGKPPDIARPRKRFRSA